MFSGIIEEVGRLSSIVKNEGVSFTIDASVGFVSSLKLGDSVCVNGVCLTVTNMKDSSFEVFATKTTVEITTHKNLKTGSSVNLEKALLATSRFDGHIVSGHVDSISRVLSVKPSKQMTEISFSLDDKISKYIALKGSIAVEGVSLTVYSLSESSFSVVLIPFSSAHTTLNALSAGESVNIETDILAKYVERILSLKEKDSRFETLLNNF